MAILPGLLRDLDILHRSGVIHRDISPDNLILTPQGTLKLLDFGSARSVQDGKSMTVMLKAGFSPVEQYQSKGQGPYTDVYALAGTVYYCLTGVIPPTAIDRLSADELKAPSFYGAQLPKQQEEALLWGMTIQPKARPQSMAAFANAMFPKTAPQNPQNPVAGVAQTVPHSGEFTPQSGRGIPQSGQGIPNSVTQSGGRQVPVAQAAPGKKKSRAGLIGLLAGVAAAAVLAVVLLVTGIFGAKTDNGFRYKLQGGEAYVVGYDGVMKNLVIPESLGGKKVVGIREGAFEDCVAFVRVTVPSTVHTVETGAFVGCSNLELVHIEGTAAEAEDDAFLDCDKLLCVIISSESQYNRLKNAFGKNTALCYVGQELLGGRLQSVRINNGVAFAITDQSIAVVLATAPGIKQDSIPGSVENFRVFDRNGERIGARMGSTEDGFTYEIYDNQAALVGYEGTETVLSIPGSVEGYPVTTLAAGCFAGNSELESLFLTENLTMISNGALSGCTNLRDLYVFGPTGAGPEAFKECTALRCVVTTDLSVNSWNKGPKCIVVDAGEDTGVGFLSYVDVTDDGVIYGVTDWDQAVVMDIPSNLSEVFLQDMVYDYPVTWIRPQALDHAQEGLYIYLGSQTGFPYEMYPRANWDYPDFGMFSQGWVFSCYICDAINARRGATEPKIYPERAIVEAALVRSEELSRSDSHTRPDGSKWSEILDEYGIEWTSASTYRQNITYKEDTFDADFEDALNKLIESYANVDDQGRYYVAFGTAMYYSASANKIFSNTLVIIRE